ncbi:MAG: C40 family peptidase [Nocardioidaceae bacterium]|nr:C40 family peptidase [Nocardioidaceae bacterium]
MPVTSPWRRLATVIPALLTAAVVLSTLAIAPADASTRRERKIHNGVEIAVSQKGDPYVYGAAGPNAFDCSGLTMYSFGKAGIKLPRSSDAQATAVRRIAKKNMRRGDLMFFHSGGNVYHEAIFLGRNNGQTWLLHASRSGTPVKRDPVWTSSWFGGTMRLRR